MCSVSPAARSERGGADRPRERDGIGATMAFYHDPGKADHAGAVIAARVQPAATRRSTGRAIEAGEPIEQEACEFLPHAIGDQAGDALHGLEGHVAGKSVGDHDIDVAGEDVVALDKAT